MRARPIHDRIIVKVDDVITSTSGGIALVESYQPQPSRGEVLAVGPGTYDEKGNFIPVTLKPGQHVIFGNYHGVEIEIDGESYRIMREMDVAAIVEGETAVIETRPCSANRNSRHRYYR